ncbi:phosphotransferase [Paraneptunicella aestuarii]|uniref:phosphotransferase n=1 Tax=Paraneptunicella aestuarii TaxID=2831148 RepID=UPI001E386154|nr:phosphotransferase [Paraneptunicella aestuarii]UAA39735.1 phosphotransferase [Paraneptunicella aestuarii]
MSQTKSALHDQLFDKATLLEEMKRQRWFAQQHIDIDSVEILDWVQIPLDGEIPIDYSSAMPPRSLYWLKIKVADTHVYSVVIERLPELKDASLHPGFFQQLKLAGDEGFVTQQGAVIKLTGDVHQHIITDMQEFEPGSSNTLMRCATPQGEYVLKQYRIVNPRSDNEVRVMQAVSEQDITPNVLGVIEYHSRSQLDEQGKRQGKAQVKYLGIMTELVHGEPIHRLYSQSIRQLIADLNQGVKTPDDILPEAAKLQPLCYKIGEHTRLFHQHLNQSYSQQIAASEGFDVQTYLTRFKGRWRRVYQAVKQDNTLTEQVRAQVLSQLRKCAKHMLTLAHPALGKTLPVSIAHSDLHLGHVFVDLEDDYYCRIIDPSPISLDPKDAMFSTQLSLMDVVSLHRGLEYFSFDEIADAIGHWQERDTSLVADELLMQPETLRASCPHLFPLLKNWSGAVVRYLNDGYRLNQSAHSLSMTEQEEIVLYQAFYFHRLLQELDYNYAYGRQFFKICDLYYLRTLTEELSL